jgi:hypothetical protein
MSTNERARKFDKDQADSLLYDLSTHIRGVKGVLRALLDMDCLQKTSLSEAYDLLTLAHHTIAQVSEKYDHQHELDWAHLIGKNEFGSTVELMVDLLACASDSSFDAAWKEKAIALCDRIRYEIYPDDRPVILRAWIDLISARGLKVCLIDKDGNRKPLIEERPEATKEIASATCG